MGRKGGSREINLETTGTIWGSKLSVWTVVIVEEVVRLYIIKRKLIEFADRLDAHWGCQPGFGPTQMEEWNGNF